MAEEYLYKGRLEVRSMLVDYLKISPLLIMLMVFHFTQEGEQLNMFIALAIPAGLLFDLLVISFIRRATSSYVITHRWITARRHFGLHKAEASLDAVTAVNIKQSFIESKFGVGTVIFSLDSARKKVKFVGVKNPEVIHSLVETAMVDREHRSRTNRFTPETSPTSEANTPGLVTVSQD